MMELFIILIINFSLINSQIKENPIFLNDKGYPFVLESNDDYYYVVTKGQYLKILISSGQISDHPPNPINSNDFIGFVDHQNNNYVYYSEKYYKITYNPFISYTEYQITKNPEIEPSIEVDIIKSNGDSILYGYKNKKLYFCSIFHDCCLLSNVFNVNLDYNLSCKLLLENILFVEQL